MPRMKDDERILDLLSGSPVGLSNQRIKNELKLKDDRYDTVREELLNNGWVEKYACRGGGIRLTAKGEKEVAPDGSVSSSVEREEDLYPFVTDALEREYKDDIVFETGHLRKRGKWQNPDVTQISIDIYPRLKKRDVVITTYEVKQWGRWDVRAVFEAASHARFAHEGFILLEWPQGDFNISEPGIAQIISECQRFGIGVATLEPYYSKHRVHVHVDPAPKRPMDGAVESWLEYALSKHADATKRFDEAMAKAEEMLAGRRPGQI